MQFRCYVRAYIQNSDGQILFLKKTDNQKIAAGLWVLPGGAIEFGETPEVSLARELKEEINFDITKCELLGTDTRIISSTHWLGLFYKVYGNNDQICNMEPSKHSELVWGDFNFYSQHLNKNELNYIQNQR